MRNEKSAAYVTIFVILAMSLFGYNRHETHTLHMNGVTYTFLGMVEQEDNGKKFYMPIYKRN